MAQYLLLDKDRNAVNAMEWDGVSEYILQPGAAGLVRYDGPYFAGWAWNGKELADPNAAPAAPAPAEAESAGVEML